MRASVSVPAPGGKPTSTLSTGLSWAIALPIASRPATAAVATGRNWADHQSFFDVHETCGETQMMNCTNDNEIYSFHVGGCNFTMGDGSVRLVQESIDPEVFVSLFTRAGNDVVGQQ